MFLLQELRLLLPLEMDSSATSNPTQVLENVRMQSSFFPQIQILLFASLISAVDPVAVLAVFGEVSFSSDMSLYLLGWSQP